MKIKPNLRRILFWTGCGLLSATIGWGQTTKVLEPQNVIPQKPGTTPVMGDPRTLSTPTDPAKPAKASDPLPPKESTIATPASPASATELKLNAPIIKEIDGAANMQAFTISGTAMQPDPLQTPSLPVPVLTTPPSIALAPALAAQNKSVPAIDSSPSTGSGNLWNTNATAVPLGTTVAPAPKNAWETKSAAGQVEYQW